MAPDSHYTDPAMVALYDPTCGWGIDREYYLALAGPDTASVLDAGCGTGLVTVAFVAAGRRVVGVDPADSMLTVARRRPGGDQVTWHCSTLEDFRCAEKFDLAYMTGHAFQCLLSEAEIVAAFTSVAKLLSPTGRFVFDTRNPDAQGWRAWQPDTSRVTGHLPDGSGYECFHTLGMIELPFISFTQTMLLDDAPAPMLSHSTLRFTPASDFPRLAASAGLAVELIFGDWDRSPVTAQSPELIVTLRL